MCPEASCFNMGLNGFNIFDNSTYLHKFIGGLNFGNRLPKWQT